MQIQLCLENNIFQKDLFWKKHSKKVAQWPKASEERQKEECI